MEEIPSSRIRFIAMPMLKNMEFISLGQVYRAEKAAHVVVPALCPGVTKLLTRV